MMALAGMVSTHATARLMEMSQRTRLTLWAAPEPAMGPAMVCVVDTGIPPRVASHRLIAPPIEAHEPLTELSLVMRVPIVLTMRQPPRYVPQAMAK